MSMIGIELRPSDTLFFGSGMPFSAEGAQEDVSGVFPPYPPTVVGAIRAWLARSQGWSGRGRWPERLRPVLGDVPVELGELEFCGPFLTRDGAPLFRAPRHLLGAREGELWTPKFSLRPGAPVRCDLGDAVRLPAIPVANTGHSEKLVPANDRWLSLAGLKDVLQGKLPAVNDVVADGELWSEERRVGLERDRSTRTALEGQLYSARHIRVTGGVGIGVGVRGIPSAWQLAFDRHIPLGGESRTTRGQRWDPNISIAGPHVALANTAKVTMISLTPLDLHERVRPGMTLLDEHGGVRVISACIDRPLRIGGWSSVNKGPLPLRSVLAPGSVLFCEAHEPERLAAALEQAGGLLRVGERKRWGFGLITLGTWTENDKDKYKR